MHSGQLAMKRDRRRGAAAVEFAVIAPVLLTIVLGTVDVARLLDAQNQLAVAAREGARLAAMDRHELLQDGQSMNEKIIEDVRGYLSSNDLPGEAVEVFIVDPDDHVTPLNLDDPPTQFELFELRIEIPFSATGWSIGYLVGDPPLSASVVFRNGRPQ
jgi:hypothetical protein